MKKISIIGFGKIGQAIAANIVSHKISVIAIDINADLNKLFQKESVPIKEPGIKEILESGFKSGFLEITDDYQTVESSDAIIIAIPLLVGKQKDILDEPFLACFKKLSLYLNNRALVVIETSIPVGYGRNVIVPLIEANGKKHGLDFLLSHSPERIKSGSMMQQLVRTPKIIGGVSLEAAEATYDVYQHFFDKSLLHVVQSIESAELVKLAGMVYRDINIALSNQLAQFASTANINFTDLIPLINTDGEANLLQPGIGVGGHCTPVYPYFLINAFKNNGLFFSLASESRRINDEMVLFAASLVKNKVINKKALILGLSFRPNVKEDTLSTTYLLSNILNREGFQVLVHDVEFSVDEIEQKRFAASDNLYEANAEVCFLVTMHKEYNTIDFKRLSESGCKYFVDGRNCFDRKKVEATGIQYFGIGR